MTIGSIFVTEKPMHIIGTISCYSLVLCQWVKRQPAKWQSANNV